MTNWQQMFVDLKRYGYGVSKISRTISVSRTRLLHWRSDGTEPLHGAGESFVQLWMVVTGKTRNELPAKCPDFDKKTAI